MAEELYTDTPSSRRERIAKIMTGEFYNKAVGKNIGMDTKIHHVSEEATRLATDALYDVAAELSSRRVEWLKIGHASEAAVLERAVTLLEEKADYVQVTLLEEQAV